MKSIFKATAILSGISVVRILVGLVSAKVMAPVPQPAGFYGMLQRFVGLTTVVACIGTACGLVRLGTSIPGTLIMRPEPVAVKNP